VLVADTQTVAEDTVATGNVLSNDSDVDDTLTVASFTVAGTAGTFNAGQTATIAGVGTLVINSNGTYTFTPVANYNGTVPVVTYTTNTGSTSTLTINVTAVNDPSVLVADTQTVAEDTVATGNVLSNDSDVDNTLTVASFSIAGVTGTFTPGQTATITGVGTLVINNNGTYTFTPVANYNGSVPVVTYTTNTGLTSTLTINVTAVNDAPVDGNETNTVTEDTTLTVLDGAAGDLLNNATDVDGDTLSITGYTIGGITGTQVVGQPVVIAGVGTLTINANGSYTFVPLANFTGTIPVITYTVSDGKGGTDTSTLTLTMSAINDAPINTLPASYTTNEDTALKLAGLSIADVDAGTGNVTVTLSVASGTLAAATAGGVTVTGSGTGTHYIDAKLGVFTELQVGSYVFMDHDYNVCDLRGLDKPTFEQALQINPKQTLHYRLGMAYLGKGDKAKAAAAFKQFISYQPTGKQAEESRKRLAELGAAG
jgi:VCBS repeat-containing protein